jgi:hypothetical protein
MDIYILFLASSNKNQSREPTSHTVHATAGVGNDMYASRPATVACIVRRTLRTYAYVVATGDVQARARHVLTVRIPVSRPRFVHFFFVLLDGSWNQSGYLILYGDRDASYKPERIYCTITRSTVQHDRFCVFLPLQL